MTWRHWEPCRENVQAAKQVEPGVLESMLDDALEYALDTSKPIACTRPGAQLVALRVERWYHENGYAVEATCEWVPGLRETKPLVTIRAKP